ncbi:hypothetical protein [Kocuria rosea]|uniref:hypothetical protein n=1 Tax=Kocuria rosea TaxID=1275 RepID=UPI0011A9900C|nr:hypothetical protein [Kocuria rosea]
MALPTRTEFLERAGATHSKLRTNGASAPTPATVARRLEVVAPRNETPKATTPMAAPARTTTAKRGQRRGVQITSRDLHILRFLAKVNLARAEHVWMVCKDFPTGHRPPESDAMGVTLILKRLYKLQQAGFVRGNANLVGCTVWGLTGKGKEEVTGEAGQRATHLGLQKWAHTLGLAFLTARAWQQGYVVISDTEMDAASKRRLNAGEAVVLDADFKKDPNYGDPALAAFYVDYLVQHGSGMGGHRPDAVIFKELANGQRVIRAVELELTLKKPDEIENILLGYVQSLSIGRFTEVVYYCTPPVKTHIAKMLRSRWNDTSRFEAIKFVNWSAEITHSNHPALRS